MNKNYLYLGMVMALVVILSVATFSNFSSKENKTLVAENIIEVEVAEPKRTSVNANKNHHDDGALSDTETVPPRVAFNNDFNYESFFASDKGEDFVKENVAQLVDILDISNPDERGVLESIARRHAANAKKLSDDHNSLMREASVISSFEIKEGKISDENKVRLEAIDAELLQFGEKFRKNAIASEDEIRNLLDEDQQKNLMEYEKDKIVAFRTESISILLKSFLGRFEGDLSADQINAIDSIPMAVASQVAVEDYNFGFSLSMYSDSIGKVNIGSGFPGSLIREAFMQLRNILTSEQIVQSKIDERLY